jgi:hypothetical protein
LIGTDVVEYYNDGVFNHVVLHITGEHRGEIQYSNKKEEAPAIIENIIGDEVIDHNFYSSSDLKKTYILEFENTNEVLSASESITDKKDMFSIALKAFLDRCNFKFLKSKTDTTTIKNSNSEKLVIKDDYTVHQYKELHAYACGEVGTIPSVFCDIALMLEGGESLKLVPYPNFEKIEEIYPDNFYFNKLKGYFLKDTSYTAGENTLKTLKEITAMTNGGGLFNKIMASVASGFSFYFPNDTDSYAIDKKQPDGSVTTVRINDKNTYLERLMLQAVDVDDNEKVLAGLESVAFSMVTELTGYLNSTDNIVLRYLEGDDTLLKDRYYEVKKIRKASRKLISVLKERQNTENVGEMGDYQQPKFIDTLLSILAGVKGFVMSYLSATDTTNELMDALEQYRTTSTVLRLVVDNSDGIEEIFKEMPPVKL